MSHLKRIQNEKVNWKQVFDLRNILQILVGVSLAVLAMRGFMIPNRFMDGGITGISILLHEIFHWNISILTLLLNAPIIYLGYRRIGKTFAVQTILAVVLLAIGLQFIDIHPITTNPLLIAIFGGVIIGCGVGLVIRSGGVIDGAEVIAVFTKRKTGFSNSEIILLINFLIFTVAGTQFGLETAMYSLITYFTATRAVDYVVDGIEQYTAVNIISAEPELIKEYLVNQKGKGITVYKGERGYLPGSFDIRTDCDIIVTIVSRLEVHHMQSAILGIDPKAFIYVQTIKEAAGGVLKAKAHVS
ncbi:MAG TPA: YitT family protein [Lacibacter sp.]|nr:YitT family protein [Lacibacter sp.]